MLRCCFKKVKKIKSLTVKQNSRGLLEKKEEYNSASEAQCAMIFLREEWITHVLIQRRGWRMQCASFLGVPWSRQSNEAVNTTENSINQREIAPAAIYHFELFATS